MRVLIRQFQFEILVQQVLKLFTIFVFGNETM